VAEPGAALGRRRAFRIPAPSSEGGALSGKLEKAGTGRLGAIAAVAFLGGGHPLDVAVGDVNGDDRRDVVSAHDAHLQVMIQGADGSFSEETLPGQPSRSSSPR
jgi:hypothetical protein